MVTGLLIIQAACDNIKPPAALRRRARGRTAPRRDARGRLCRRRRDPPACGRRAARGDSRAPESRIGVGGVAQQLRPAASGCATSSSTGPMRCGVDPDMRQSDARRSARPECRGRGRHAAATSRLPSVGGGRIRSAAVTAGEFDMQIDAVEQRSRQPRPDSRRRSAGSGRACRQSRDRWHGRSGTGSSPPPA